MRSSKEIIISGVVLFIVSINVAFAQKKINYTAIMRSNVGTDTMWDGQFFRIYGITDKLSASSVIPAKILYANEGDTVVINTLNISQNSHHTIHLHGLDVDTRNDGDPATSFSLKHMQDTTYTFVAKHAGTYLYHCHAGDVVHVQMGMYGLIIVNVAGGIKKTQTKGGELFDKSYNWLLSEIDRGWHDNIPEMDLKTDTLQIPLYKPQYFLINGKSETELDKDSTIKIEGRQNEKIYLRIGAIGFYTNQIIFPAWLNARIIDSDGRPLPVEIDSDTLNIAPGERYGVMLKPSAQLADKIKVNFINMNTDSVWSRQLINVDVKGFLSDGNTLKPNPTLSIYPNPASDQIVVSLQKPSSEIYSLKIFDSIGKMVYTDSFIPPSSLFKVCLPKGIYFVKIENSISSYTSKLTVSN